MIVFSSCFFFFLVYLGCPLPCILHHDITILHLGKLERAEKQHKLAAMAPQA